MIKAILMAAFFLVVLLLSLLNGAEQTELHYWIKGEPARLPMGLVVFVTATAGALFSALVWLLDRSPLAAEHRRLKKRLAQADKELEELRQIMTVDRDEA